MDAAGGGSPNRPTPTTGDVRRSRTTDAPPGAPGSVTTRSRGSNRDYLGQLGVALAAALIGGAISAGAVYWQVREQTDVVLAQEHRQFELTRELEIQNARRPIYREFLAAAGRWANAQRVWAVCQGQEVPVVRVDPADCAGIPTEVDASRREFRASKNAMETVESAGGFVARRLLSASLPSSAPREGETEMGLPAPFFVSAYDLFLAQMRCDTNPTADATRCAETLSDVRSAFAIHVS